MPGERPLLSPPWPWLPPAATGQRAAVSSFSHPVGDPGRFLPPAARREGFFSLPSCSRGTGAGAGMISYPFVLGKLRHGSR